MDDGYKWTIEQRERFIATIYLTTQTVGKLILAVKLLIVVQIILVLMTTLSVLRPYYGG